MKNKPLLHLITGYIIIAVLTFSAVIIAGRTYTVYLQDIYKNSEAKIEVLDESIIKQSEAVVKKDNCLKVKFKADNSGKTRITLTVFNADNKKEYTRACYDVSVLPTRVIYVTGCDFGGYQFVLLGIFLTALFSFAFALKQYRLRKKQQFFSYKTVLDLALIIFFGVQGVMYAETESATTLENMLFSKKIADSVKPNANILFSTTKYHVFRSAILSAKAGLRADGIGAKTKWYFWPNAQMREFIGLLACEWRVNIVFILLTVIVSALMANTSTIVNFLIH